MVVVQAGPRDHLGSIKPASKTPRPSRRGAATCNFRSSPSADLGTAAIMRA